MESGDLYLRMGPRSRGDRCPLLFRSLSPSGEVHETTVSATIPKHFQGDAVVVALTLGELGGHLADYLNSRRAVHPGVIVGNVLLDIRASDLYGLDWETITPMLMATGCTVTRFIDVSDERLLVPFDLPARVLLLERRPLALGPTEGALQYFRTHKVAGFDNADLLDTLQRGRFDIVHLAAVARWRDDDAGAELSIVGPSPTELEWIAPAALRRALDACGARLLVLQGDSPDDQAPRLDVVHRLLAAGGPTTVVATAATPAYWDNLYLAIVHDTDLDRAARQHLAPPMHVALLLGIGGASVLRISPMAQQLARAVRRSTAVLENLAENASFRHFAESPMSPVVPEGLSVDLENTALHARDLAARTYNYAHETGAWVPLAEDSRQHAALQGQIEALNAAIGRVVNVGLLAGDVRLPAATALKPGAAYHLAVQIGQPADWSLAREPKPIPEGELVHLYSDEGVELSVMVFAPGFDIKGAEYRLMLPPPPRASNELRVALRAPDKLGRHRIRVAIYHRNNLLQSVLMKTTVHAGQGRVPHQDNIHADVEFALSETLTDPSRLPARTVNFLTNAGDDGTHTFAIVGGPLRKQFDFDDGQMREAVGEVRKSLFSIAADTTAGKPAYRFDNNNSATIAQLEQDLARLAELGYALYTKIVTAEDASFEDQLQQALGPSGATIQISATKSAQYVFPWSLVYDQPLVVGGLSLCPQFASDLKAARAARSPLTKAVCLTRGCPHRDDVSVVCPSGFWGFKHLIEQPLSVASKSNVNGHADVVIDVNVGPTGVPIPALMAVSRELQQVAAHTAELGQPSSFLFDVKDTKVEVGLHMKEAATLGSHLIYFYCHGGRDRSRTWLGIGSKERLVPSDLHAWKIDWVGVNPLVFINGCHTADLTPDDLLNFNQMFAHCRAAGVVGTEIDVPESLARDFARGFIEQFGGGSTVGAALAHQRLSLLERCNLLGLAYTPYCSASHRLVHT